MAAQTSKSYTRVAHLYVFLTSSVCLLTVLNCNGALKEHLPSLSWFACCQLVTLGARAKLRAHEDENANGECWLCCCLTIYQHDVIMNVAVAG